MINLEPLKYLTVLCIIFVPLGAWKATEIVVWAVSTLLR